MSQVASVCNGILVSFGVHFFSSSEFPHYRTPKT